MKSVANYKVQDSQGEGHSLHKNAALKQEDYQFIFSNYKNNNE